jgi:hypothetical protein
MISGGAECWGSNNVGQLGNGTTLNSGVPADVVDIDDAVAITAGAGHVCVLTTAATVRCWGDNSYGQLGDGHNCGDVCTIPVTVAGLRNVVALVAGTGHMCALSEAGVVKCWGANQSGQLGDGTTTNQSTPVEVLWGTPPPASSAAMAVDCDGDASGVQGTCSYDTGESFTAQVHVLRPPAAGYGGLEFRLRWTDELLGFLDPPEFLWSGCTTALHVPQQTGLLIACLPLDLDGEGPPAFPYEISYATGPVLEVRLTCLTPGDTWLALASSTDDLGEGQVFITTNGEYDARGAELVHAHVTCSGG